MGAIQNESAIYLNVIGGKLRSKTSADDPNATSRENKKGNTVYERVYDGWQGKIVNLESRKTDFGPELKVSVLDDQGQLAKIGMMINGSIFRDFANRLLSFDPKEIVSEEMKIMPFTYTNDGFDNHYMGLCLESEDKTRTTKYKKGDDGYPDWEKKEDPSTGKMVWSKIAQRDFLIKELNELMNEVKELRGVDPEPSSQVQDDSPEPEEMDSAVDEDEDDDPLPF